MIKHQQRELLAKLFMLTITLSGWAIIIGASTRIELTYDSLLLLILFILFLGVTEYYPFPVWKGFSTINFPIIFIVLLIYGLPLMLVVYSLIVMSVNILHKRPIRSVLFNPAQLIISLFSAHILVTTLYSIDQITFTSNILDGLIIYSTFLIVFYLINNLFVDIVLWLRPQPYTFYNWKQKLISELASGGFSFLYGIIFYILGNQNRGEVDLFSYFFFLFPLIAMSLIGSSFVRLNTEKNRLNKMFRLTRNLNTHMLKDRFGQSMTELNNFMNCDEVSLVIKEDENWTVAYPNNKLTLTTDIEDHLNELRSMTSYEQKPGEPNGLLSHIFFK
ncbi:putative membrane protein YhdT [Alkalibacillus filiformis]|uniref:Membrane protein YhdT n=1 Tax=Alkalibacillus filiformis TaxID=200990 RepID=A0ABU0DT83_9BACI|nr:hypothetical protein [Alkalibacillus filiformis]MDQ0351491.1 putative membrane protein YhdT [Alkalibacillus filiformis]